MDHISRRLSCSIDDPSSVPDWESRITLVRNVLLYCKHMIELVIISPVDQRHLTGMQLSGVELHAAMVGAACCFELLCSNSNSV